MKKNKLKGSSLDKQEELLEFLKSDLPEIFSEGKIDCKKLKQTLGEEVDDSNERYGLSWAGKNNCFQTIQGQTTATLKPAKDESVDFDKTQNLFIEGDNLEVLKVLQRSYYGKVKMIYIDPPYNTGNDFIYNDKFQENRDEYLESIGEKDGNGNSLRVDGLSRNTKDSGHYHSNWLNMMYPRLFLARNLLKQDGVIFVSIDDNEVANLRIIMDEIFGEDNFIAEFTWVRKKKGAFLSKKVRKMTEYVLCYQKSENDLKMFGEEAYTDKQQPIVKRTNSLKMLTFPAGFVKTRLTDGFYDATENKNRTGISFLNSFEVKDGNVVSELKTKARYVWTQEFLNKEMQKGSEVHLSTKFGFNVLRYNQKEKTKTPSTLINKDRGVGTYEDATAEIAEIFDAEIGSIFDYAKPASLIRFLVNAVTFDDKNGIILDFFAGSGTTAQAVMEQNAKDGRNRKWICVQLPELCDEESEAYKAGYKTIAEIGKERIRRAGSAVAKAITDKKKIDIGFKVLKLDKSNFKIWSYSAKASSDKQGKSILEYMEEFVDNVQKGSKEENILFELILKSGLDLNVPVKEKKFNGDKYYSLDSGKLIIYLGKKITKEMAEEIKKAKPEKFICLDGCFQNNDQLKTNISLQLEQEKIDFKVI